jgi:hypothetical protein
MAGIYFTGRSFSLLLIWALCDFSLRELYLTGGTTCGRAGAARRTSPNWGRWPFTAFRKRGERGEYSFSAIVTTGARGIFIYLALVAKQFKLKVTIRAKIFINGHFLILSFLKSS